MSDEPDVGRVEKLVALRSFPGWAELPTPELAALSELAEPRAAPVGTTLLSEGQPVTTIYLVMRGELTIRRDGVEIGRYGPHSGVGGLAAFARDPRGYECEATRDSLLLALHADELEEVFEDRFVVLGSVLRELARETVRLRRRMRPNAGFPAEADPGERCPARRLDLVERIFFLRRNLAFASGFIDSIAALARSAEELRLAPGERLWRAEDRADHLLAVVCGTIEARTPDGTTFAFGAGDLVGGLDAVGEVPRWFDAEVGEGLVALRMESDPTLDVFEDHPDLGLDVLQGFSAALLALLETHAARPDAHRSLL